MPGPAPGARLSAWPPARLQGLVDAVAPRSLRVRQSWSSARSSPNVASGLTPGTGRRCKAGAAPPAQTSTRAGSLPRSSVRASTTWFGFMHPVKLKRHDVTLQRLRWRARCPTPAWRLRARRSGRLPARAWLRPSAGPDHAARRGRWSAAREGSPANRPGAGPRWPAAGRPAPFGVQVLLEDFELPPHPGFADPRIQRGR